jgi:hypothetical protein
MEFRSGFHNEPVTKLRRRTVTNYCPYILFYIHHIKNIQVKSIIIIVSIFYTVWAYAL